MTQDKVAIVTGGSRGLGRSTVENLCRRGVVCIFTYNTNQTEAAKLAEAVGRAGGAAHPLQLDTGDCSQFDRFAGEVETILANLGRDRADFLVNNAGTSHHAAITDTTEADLDALYRVHVKGPFFLTQRLLPLIADGGRIVNISSGLTRFAVPETGAYATVKGAVEVFTRHLAKELGPRGIAVNVVAPGAIQTDFSGGVVRDNPEVNSMVAGMTALGRAGLPEDIGPMIASLLSEDNRWINGQRIEVSGGMML